MLKIKWVLPLLKSVGGKEKGAYSWPYLRKPLSVHHVTAAQAAHALFVCSGRHSRAVGSCRKKGASPLPFFLSTLAQAKQHRRVAFPNEKRHLLVCASKRVINKLLCCKRYPVKLWVEKDYSSQFNNQKQHKTLLFINFLN